MSPKKPYQKRLPNVLPPAPRRAPAQEAIRPRPAPPRARRSPPAGPSVAPPSAVPPVVQPPDPAPVEAAAPTTTAPDAAGSPDIRGSSHLSAETSADKRELRTTSPVEPDAVAAPLTVPSPAPTAPPVSPPTGPAPRSGRQSRRTLALAAAALVGVVAGGVVAWQVVGPGQQSGTPTASLPIDGWPIAAESRAVTEVLPGGDLAVTHWIHAEDPIGELSLTLPELDGAEVSATGVEVTADGRAASGPATVAPSGATYTFADATRIQVRYRMTGAVELSSSADGRGLATTTSLDVSATQARDVRVVRSQEVLSLACADPGAQPLPCGVSEGDDQWRVELAGADAGNRVLAVVTVPS